MKKLISRAHGADICNISEEDFLILSKKLIRGSVTSSGYYLNLETLSLLGGTSISKAVLRSLRRHVAQGGLDLGWETESDGLEPAIAGKVLDSLDEPLGGIRVSLLSAGHRVLNWSYSKPSGDYHVAFPEDTRPQWIRFAGRGDLILTEFPVDEERFREEVLISTLSGKIVNQAQEPIPEVSVQLVAWKEAPDSVYRRIGSKGGGQTWGDTDKFGQFTIPIRIENPEKKWEAILEVMAPLGQTLRKLTVDIYPNESLDLGHLICPQPKEEWGGDVVEPKRSVVMYPGVSEYPLS